MAQGSLEKGLESRNMATIPDAVSVCTSPAETYKTLVNSGQRKGTMSILANVISGILAGMYIAIGGFLFFVVTGGMQELVPIVPGIVKLVGGLVFPVGLALVVNTGAELFTGNASNMFIAIYEKQATLYGLVKNWVCSWVGNLMGSLLIVLLAWLTKILEVDSAMIIKTAETKVHLSFQVAMFRAMGCNWLVCMAVYMATSSNSLSGKILGLWGPIAAFVTIGFEHVVANMFFIPMGMALGANISIGQFLFYCIPVTIGNVFSAAIFVATAFGFLHGSLGEKLV